MAVVRRTHEKWSYVPVLQSTGFCTLHGLAAIRVHELLQGALDTSDVNKANSVKAKAKARQYKAKAKAKANARGLQGQGQGQPIQGQGQGQGQRSSRPRPRTSNDKIKVVNLQTTA